MLVFRRLIEFVAHENDPVFLNADFFARLQGSFQECFLRDQRFRARVFQLESQLLSCVTWIGWGSDTTCP